MKWRVRPQWQSGFTAVEMLITLAVTVVFLNAFYTLFNSVSLSSSIAQDDIEASDFAYNSLQYGLGTNGKSPCDTNVSTTTNTNNLLINPNAPGTPVTDPSGSNPWTAGTTPPAPFTFPGPYTVTGLVFYPYGCGSNKAAKVTVTIVYGPNSRKVTHAAYVL